MSQKVLIVGGVAGGASAAARLRRLDETAQIIMFEKGEYISFANCGLPYYIGGEIKDRSALTLQTPESFRMRFDVDVRVFSEVVAIDRESHTVTVKNVRTKETYRETYDKLILSMGAEPVLPPVDGIRSDRVFTLRNIPDTYRIKEYVEQKKPRSAAVLGGGYIGVEMAENLKMAGLSVTLIEMSDQVIAPLDYDMAGDVHRHIESKGVNLLLSNTVRSLREQDGTLYIAVNSGEVSCDMVVAATGVRPETEIAKECGLTLNARGAIVVHPSMQTNDPDIYAVGDSVEVIDFVSKEKTVIPLAGPANKQGRIAADNIAGGHSTYTGTQGSAILKVFDMTAATTGINEKTAKRLNIAYEKSFTYSASHAGYYPGAVNMSVKILYSPENGRLLGAQVVGFDGVDKRCDVFATAIRAHMTVEDLTRLELCYAPPYSSAKDPVNMAGYVAENIRTGKVRLFHWHDVADLPRDGSVQLVDTRSELEFENGHIDGFINLPVDNLRELLSSLDKKKPVYITCQIGLRGYIAARILMQHGFEAYNLSGGYRLYDSIFGHEETPSLTHLIDAETQRPKEPIEEPSKESSAPVICVDACGLQCPGPVVKLSAALEEAQTGQIVEISTTDPAFASDLDGYCRRTGNCLETLSNDKGICVARIKKGSGITQHPIDGEKKNMIVFSGDLDKAIASFIIANAAAAMGRKVSMFFTFWGLNILRKPEKVSVKKDFMSKMFAKMMPRGSKKLKLSNMNMMGLGPKMIRSVMKNKNIDSLEDLIALAQKNGVELLACSMSMDVMGITLEELLPGVKLAGAAAMLANAEESDMSLFI